MKKIIFTFMGFIILSACADGNVNQDLYNKDNPDFEIVTMRGIGYKVVKK